MLKRRNLYLMLTFGLLCVVIYYFQKNRTSSRFMIQDHFTPPMPKVTLPIHELMEQQWMSDLQDFLLESSQHVNTSRHLITIVTCDSTFKHFLLNWLISACLDTHAPITNILVLALDKPLQNTLTAHGFNSVYIDPKHLVTSSTLSKLSNTKQSGFFVVMILRLTVMRLLNHWGYDAANYDSDAIILKNPEVLFYEEFSDSHLVASRGRFPDSANEKFGLTMCAGMFMIKSSPETEIFWRKVSEVLPRNMNDQEKLNTALMEMDLQWNNVSLREEINWVGRSSSGFVITVLHMMLVCRRWCEKTKKESYYVWHHGGKFVEGKIEHVRSEDMWFLKRDWNNVAEESTASGLTWLEAMKVT